MKKKLLMVAVLLGALSLGACIDDNESQSVTNVRNSKAAELKSIAAMEKAEAEARVTLANAEAALNAAKVKAEQALAAKARAQAEMEAKQLELIELQKEAATLQNEKELIENQKKQAELDAELAQLAVTQKENEEQLARIANEVLLLEQQNQTALYEAQLALERAEQDLLDKNEALANAKTEAERQTILAERTKLQQRSAAYTQAVNELIVAKTTLSSYQTALVTLQTGLTTLQESKESTIADNNVTIAENLVKIDIYKQYQNYQEDPEALKNKIEDLQIENNKLADVNNAKLNAYWDVEVNTDAVEAADEEIEALDFYNFVINGGNVAGEYESVGNDGIINKSSFTVYTLNSYVPKADAGKYRKYYYYTPEGADVPYWVSIGDSIYVDCDELTADIRQVELAVNSDLNNYTTWLENENRGLKEAQSQYDGVPMYYEWDSTTEKWVEKVIEDGVNAVDNTAAKKKLMDETTDDAEKAQYKVEYEAAIVQENNLKDRIVNCKNTIAYYTACIEALKAGWKMYQEYDANVEALQAKLDARNEADVNAYSAKVVAWKEYRDVNAAYSKVNAEYNAAQTLYWGAIPVQDPSSGDEYYVNSVKNIADAIAALEAENEALEAENANFAAITTQEELIAAQNARIAAQTAVVTAKEAAVEATKAALKEVMELPEEGEGEVTE